MSSNSITFRTKTFIVVATLVMLGALIIAGCARPASHVVVDALLSTAHRPRSVELGPGSSLSKYQVLAGDLHCHVSPPDARSHVSRNLAETITLARSENLDFVVLTPHFRARFFLDTQSRAWAVEALARLERELAQHAPKDILFFVGFEYTDFEYGHVGGAFASLDDVFAHLSVTQNVKDPGAFFETYVAQGGLLFVNHPLVTPLDSSVGMANVDMSWRPFTGHQPFPSEIVAAHRLAHGFEAFNLTVFDLRDRFLQPDPHTTLLQTMARLDQQTLIERRRFIPVGGSDSHSDHLRASTFVLAEERSPKAIREAILAGRVCVRDPAGCTFEAREPGGVWMPVGSSLQNVDEIEMQARGDDLQFIVDGNLVYGGTARKNWRVRVDKRYCSILRARVDEGYSAPIYVNCPFD